jgi:hypothetical protein
MSSGFGGKVRRETTRNSWKVSGRILYMTLGECKGEVWTGLIWLGRGTSGGGFVNM